MNAVEALKRIAMQLPETHPQITEFPSGAAMLDIIIQGESFCVEYLPSLNAYGLSKNTSTSPFWEGVEQSFNSAEELKQRILELMCRSVEK